MRQRQPQTAAGYRVEAARQRSEPDAATRTRGAVDSGAGPVTDRLGSGLQSRVERFDSPSRRVPPVVAERQDAAVLVARSGPRLVVGAAVTVGPRHLGDGAWVGVVGQDALVQFVVAVIELAADLGVVRERPNESVAVAHVPTFSSVPSQ